jgi:hypothetical protein
MSFEPLSDFGIRAILSQVHPNLQISEDAIKFLQTILMPLNDSLTNALNVSNFIQDKFAGELGERALNVYVNNNKNLKVIMQYLIAEILRLAGNRSKFAIESEDIIKTIKGDEELSSALNAYFPLFPYKRTKLYYRMELLTRRDVPEDLPEYIFESLNNAMGCLVNYYGNDSTRDFVLVVANLILIYARQLQPTGPLGFLTLLYATYNNPDLTNVPWTEIFKNC